jgi:hypothetical protein
MAQDSGLVYRGLLLLGMMLVLVALVLFVVFRRAEPSSHQNPQEAGLVVTALPTPGLTFPAQINWGALGQLSGKLPASQGWHVRYNATLALARAGSEQIPLDVLAQMLDEDMQMRNFLVLGDDGKVVADEPAARRTVFNALKGLADWHKHKEAVDKVGRDNPELLRAYAAVDRLTQSPNEELQQEAKSIMEKIASGKW